MNAYFTFHSFVAMILMASTEVDSTGASYYGKQTLYFLNTKGDSCSVPLNKEGPIHAVQWNPKGNEFCVIYGYMPSKATFFNLKCDAVFEVKEAARNSIYFSKNHLLFCLFRKANCCYVFFSIVNMFRVFHRSIR